MKRIMRLLTACLALLVSVTAFAGRGDCKSCKSCPTCPIRYSEDSREETKNKRRNSRKHPRGKRVYREEMSDDADADTPPQAASEYPPMVADDTDTESAPEE